MTTNNQVILTGNLGSEARILGEGDKLFAAFSIATQDSYKDKQDEWKQKETIWHNVLTFNPELVELVKAFKKGTRLQVTGSLSYREFTYKPPKGKTIKKREASVIAHAIEAKPLVKKSAPAEPEPS